MVDVIPESLRPGIGCRWDYYIPGTPRDASRDLLQSQVESSMPIEDLAVDTFSSSDTTFVQEEGGIQADNGVVVGSDIPIARMDWLRSAFFETTKRFEHGQEWVLEAIASGKALGIDRPLTDCLWEAAYTTPGVEMESTSRPGEEEGVTVMGFTPVREDPIQPKELTELEVRIEDEVFPVQGVRKYTEDDVDLVDLVLRTSPDITGWDFTNSIVVTTGERTVTYEEHKALFRLVQAWYEDHDWAAPGLDSSAWIAT